MYLKSSSLIPLLPRISVNILHTVLYTFPMGADKENLFNSQELLKLVIISFFLMTLHNLGMIL